MSNFGGQFHEMGVRHSAVVANSQPFISVGLKSPAFAGPRTGGFRAGLPAVPWPLSDMGTFASAEEIYRAASDFAESFDCVALPPAMVHAPHSNEHLDITKHASSHAAQVCGDLCADSFEPAGRIGDLLMWTGRNGAGQLVAGVTYVAPSHQLSADLVMGIHRTLVASDESCMIHEPHLLAQFALLCQCVAVPKTRALLMGSLPEAKKLTKRELQVMKASAAGAPAHVVASSIGISQRTVHAYVQAAMAKLGCKSKSHALMQAQRLGLL